ncbi:YIEGIA family protein [Ammoniphilus sp. YIM 78166]|uniref:YIEGIA family protein n=1 Tax=Ammoniphilus sp. YIM 78166 TaxID=1644106 RepID=UPI00106FA66B|nr:YIEGIA family protein [Ammoniphilus sp. YIM 78166]
MENYTAAVIMGVVVGIISRILMLRTDYRSYPTYPHGQVIHLALGVIAAGLGSVAVPAFMEEDFTAVTFLGLAASQFRDVRNMERNTLQQLDQMELVPRGTAYIEGIAMVFEGRNYLVMLTSILTTAGTILWGWKWGIVIGLATLLIDKIFMSGKNVGDIAEVKEGTIRMEGQHLYVDDIYIMNVGLEDTRKKIQKQAMGMILTPKNANGVVTLGNLGQRQAVLHDVATVLGVFRDAGEPSLVPLIKRSLDDGRLGVFLLPQLRDAEKIKATIKRVPVLESIYRKPLEAKVNK